MTAPDLWPTKAMVAEAAEDGKGFWNTCSGCHYSNEGYPTGPYHPVLQCHVGGGCFECGGIGAIWDTTNYAAMGDCLAQENTRAPLAEAHPLADEARAALANDDVAGWIGSLPKATLAEALAVPEVAALDEIRNLLVRDPDSRLFGISRETLEALAALRAIGERADG